MSFLHLQGEMTHYKQNKRIKIYYTELLPVFIYVFLLYNNNTTSYNKTQKVIIQYIIPAFRAKENNQQ